MTDLTNETIEKLFYKQVKKLSVNKLHKSFDLQFSDGWI